MQIVASRVSVYEIELDLREWGEVLSSAVPGFPDALTAAVPTVRAHKCMSGREGGFLEEVRRGTNLAHVIEHVLLELLNLAHPASTSYTGWTRQTGPHTYVVHYSAPDFLRGRMAAVMGVDLVRTLLRGAPVTLDRYLAPLRDPTDCFTENDQLLATALDLRGTAAAEAGTAAAAAEFTAEHAQRVAGLFRQLAAELPGITERWQAAFLDYAGGFGRSILDKVALVHPDRFLEQVLAEDRPAYERALERAGRLLAASAIPAHFVVHSLWLYKSALLETVVARCGPQPETLCAALSDCEVFFQVILRTVSAAMAAPADGADAGQRSGVSEFREVGASVGRILVIDDDDMVRRVCREMLRYRGYDTATASDGTEALRILASEDGIRGVILDVRLRGMDSREVYRHLQVMRPGIATLMVTGYPITADVRAGYPEDDVAWLQKPFHWSELVTTVERLWGAPCRAG